MAQSTSSGGGEEPLQASILPGSDADKAQIDLSNNIESSDDSGSSNSNGASSSSTTPPSPATANSLPLTLPPAPWGMSTTILVMTSWLICFYIAAYDIVPFMLRTLGYGGAAAAAQPGVQALRHLLLDTTQLSITLFLLIRTLHQHQPRKLGLFAFRLSPLKSWLPAVLLGVCAFPIVDCIHKAMVSMLSTSTGVAVSPVSNAPGWAVAASSLVFATVHFTKEGFVPLLLLGCVFGTAYLKTLNLLPAVALHSLWNIALLTQILMSG